MTGVPRMKEVLKTASKVISTPIMEVPFLHHVSKSRAEAMRIRLSEVSLGKVGRLPSSGHSDNLTNLILLRTLSPSPHYHSRSQDTHITYYHAFLYVFTITITAVCVFRC